MKKRILVAFVSALMLLPFCPGCFKTGGSRALTVCTSIDEDLAFAYIAEFKKFHPGIDVRILFIDENGLEDAVRLPESERPDVVWGCSAVELIKIAADGLVLPHAPENIKSLKPEFIDSTGSPPLWTGMSVYVNCFALSEYRTLKNPFPAPYSYDELLSPALKSGIVAPDPIRTGTGFMFVSAVLQKYGEEKGWEYLMRLDENVLYYTDEPSSPVKEAGRGNCMLGISFLRRGECELKKNAPIIVTVPEGAGWDIESNALVRKGSVNPLAGVFLDWAVSNLMMKIYARHSVEVALAGTDGDAFRKYTSGGNQPISKVLAGNDLRWAANNRERITADWQRRFGGKCRSESSSFIPKKKTSQSSSPN